jgi:L-alanine-DL-glutamate epimerase-like enolase superfamily enzyme
MKISKVEYFKVEMPLSIPYTIAYQTVEKTTNVILKITTNTGLTGWGCAAPDLEVTGETSDEVCEHVDKQIIELLEGQFPFQMAGYNHKMKTLCPNASSTRTMVDMALYDLMARHAKLPLYQLLGGFRKKIATSITIGILPLAETLAQAKTFLKQHFKIIKLKGGLNLEEDIEKVLKLREQLGTDFKLRFDANQGYTFKDAVEFINATKSAEIEILEQPTESGEDKPLRQVTQNVDIPVMADEGLKTLKDTFRLAQNEVVDMINIKLMKVGGIMEGFHINSVAKAAGIEAMVGCIDECALGISAGLHFALSRPNIEFADLDGHLDLQNDPFSNLFTLKSGILYPSEAYGLGKIDI